MPLHMNLGRPIYEDDIYIFNNVSDLCEVFGDCKGRVGLD